VGRADGRAGTAGSSIRSSFIHGGAGGGGGGVDGRDGDGDSDGLDDGFSGAAGGGDGDDVGGGDGVRVGGRAGDGDNRRREGRRRRLDDAGGSQATQLRLAFEPSREGENQHVDHAGEPDDWSSQDAADTRLRTRLRRQEPRTIVEVK